jgi:hypothetical protein
VVAIPNFSQLGAPPVAEMQMMVFYSLRRIHMANGTELEN